MKLLHRDGLYGWSRFDESRNIDFNSVLWQRPDGNVVFDPLPLTPHDEKHLRALGGAAHIVLTNSDHVRAAVDLAEMTGARVAGPAGERSTFPIPCDIWLNDGDAVVPGLSVLAMEGSKTNGELACVLDEVTLVTGDLVRFHRGGELTTLPAGKLSDVARAHHSVRRLASLENVTAVLVGDGWPVFSEGRRALAALAAQLTS